MYDIIKKSTFAGDAEFESLSEIVENPLKLDLSFNVLMAFLIAFFNSSTISGVSA